MTKKRNFSEERESAIERARALREAHGIKQKVYHHLKYIEGRLAEYQETPDSPIMVIRYDGDKRIVEPKVDMSEAINTLETKKKRKGKLTPEEKREIGEALQQGGRGTASRLATKYGVSVTTISLLKKELGIK